MTERYLVGKQWVRIAPGVRARQHAELLPWEKSFVIDVDVEASETMAAPLPKRYDVTVMAVVDGHEQADAYEALSVALAQCAALVRGRPPGARLLPLETNQQVRALDVRAEERSDVTR